MKLSVIIPVYNEKDTIEEILKRVLSVEIGFEKEIIIIDDGSQDGTREILDTLEEDNIKIYLHQENKGKGTALQTGFTKATGDIILIQDADLEYDPQDYPKLLEPILDGRADVVYGSRFLGGPHRVLLFWHYIGNQFLTTLCNMFSNLNLNDMETCYKVFKKDGVAAIFHIIRFKFFN
jgi:glycosyltransferase involved in cell wall biosynthesis